MEFKDWLALVSVGVTATALGIPLGSFVKWLLKELIGGVLLKPEANGNSGDVPPSRA